MSTIGIRPKNARETYVKQLSYGRGITPCINKKRDIFTNMNPLDDTDLAYRSTSNYLRQIAHQTSQSPTEMLDARNIPRTKSASELTPRNDLSRSMTGNPKYKAQEDYYDEIQLLKKDMKAIKDENSNLRAKIRRLEEDNVRKRKEIDALYDSSKDGDLRRSLSGSATDRNNNHHNVNTTSVVMSLKQRIFKLESQLKERETAIDELKSDPRWTKSAELELQNRALFGEIEREKVERLNYIQKNDYVASLDEEKKNAVRNLTRERDELKQENQSLKKKVQELQKTEHREQLSARPSDNHNDEELKQIKHESDQAKKDLKRMQREFDQTQEKLDQTNKDLKLTQRELNQTQEKLDQANENMERMKREKPKQTNDDSEGIRRERDQFREKLDRAKKELDEVERDRDQNKRKFDHVNEELEEMKHARDRYKKQLDEANEKLNRIREEPSKSSISPSARVSTPPIRSQSPIDEKPKEPTRKSPTPSSMGSKSNIPGNDGVSSRPTSANPSKEHRPTTPPNSHHRSSPAGSIIGGGSKKNLTTEPKKSGSHTQLPAQDQNLASKSDRSSLSRTNDRKPSSADPDTGAGGRLSLRTQQRETDSNDQSSRGDRDLSSKPSPSSLSSKQTSAVNTSSRESVRAKPSEDHHTPPKKSPTSSKQSIKQTQSDDDDDVVF